MKKIVIVLLVCMAAGIYAQQNTAPEGFVRINGGTFTMGSPATERGREDDETQRQVTVSSFYMGKCEVTKKEWYDVMGTTVRQQRDKADKSLSTAGEGNNYPMYYVSWLEAVEYCNKRSQKEGLTPAYTINGTNVTWNKNANGYRLPTEAEWEYACRAGTKTRYWSGDNDTTLAGKENIADLTLKDRLGDQLKAWTEIRDGHVATSPVGSFQANPWGLYDMHGNVIEWCWDWYGNYASGAQTDPVGASSGSFRVIRGGSWFFSAAYVRSAFRFRGTPSNRYSYMGFRLVRP